MKLAYCEGYGYYMLRKINKFYIGIVCFVVLLLVVLFGQHNKENNVIEKAEKILSKNGIVVNSISLEERIDGHNIKTMNIDCDGFIDLPRDKREKIADQLSFFQGKTFYCPEFKEKNISLDVNGLTEEEAFNKTDQEEGMYYSEEEGKWINIEPPMSPDEANRLIGTGYGGTIPNSLAESIALDSACEKCRECKMHTDNGANTKCDACLRNDKEYQKLMVKKTMGND